MIRKIVKTVAYKDTPIWAVVVKNEDNTYDLCYFNNSKEVNVYSQLNKKELNKTLEYDEYIVRDVKTPINIYYQEEIN